MSKYDHNIILKFWFFFANFLLNFFLNYQEKSKRLHLHTYGTYTCLNIGKPMNHFASSDRLVQTIKSETLKSLSLE